MVAKKKRPEKVKQAKLRGEDRSAIHMASRHGLYMLVEDDGPGRRWEIWDRRTGQRLLTYWTDSRRWNDGRLSGKCRHWREAIRLAADRVTTNKTP